MSRDIADTEKGHPDGHGLERGRDGNEAPSGVGSGYADTGERGVRRAGGLPAGVLQVQTTVAGRGPSRAGGTVSTAAPLPTVDAGDPGGRDRPAAQRVALVQR